MSYTRFKKMGVISGRDIILILNFTVDDFGTVYIVVYSVDREDLMPQQPNYVRAAIPIGGWRVDHVKDSPGKIRITYCVELDVKGNVPKFLLSVPMKDQAKYLGKIGDLVAELEKKT